MEPIIIKHKHVRLEQKVADCVGSKRVELLSDAGVVHAIELHCSCGEVTVVELEYEPREESS